MKTVVGLFDDFGQAKSAAVEVERMGVAHTDISVLANNENGAHGVNDVNADKGMGHAVTKDAGVGAEIGVVVGAVAGGLSIFLLPGLGFLAGAGWLAGALTGAGIGAMAGGLVGVLASVGIPHADAAYYNEGVRRGGTLVAVRAEDANANSVGSVLSAHGAVNIEERSALYRSEGLVV